MPFTKLVAWLKRRAERKSAIDREAAEMIARLGPEEAYQEARAAARQIAQGRFIDGERDAHFYAMVRKRIGQFSGRNARRHFRKRWKRSSTSFVPYPLYQVSHSLRLEPRHDHLVHEHPVAFVRLTSALIDPVACPVPNDLATLLQECLNANPAVANHPAYIRLYGLRRQRGA
jgi:hypothetical protein